MGVGAWVGHRGAVLSSANGQPGGSVLVWVTPLCSTKEDPNHPCNGEVYQETKVVNLAGSLTQPQHTEYTGLVALLLRGPSGATCQSSAADKK